MGDHLALLVDRLLTESTLEATIESRKQARNLPDDSDSSAVPIVEFGQKRKKGEKLVECRICQEEDEASNMEIPCSCCGSLKYAHRKCIQRWCNEKGDTTCEICLQQFKPGYTAPPQLFHYGGIPMNFRGSWEISSRDLQDSQIITMVPSGRGYMDSDYDYYAASTARSTLCCRSVAIIFTTLLVLRHSLPLLIGEAEEYSVTLFSLLVLRTAGVLIPIAVILKLFSVFLLRRRQQEARDIPISGSDEESLTPHPIYHAQPHLARVR